MPYHIKAAVEEYSTFEDQSLLRTCSSNGGKNRFSKREKQTVQFNKTVLNQNLISCFGKSSFYGLSNDLKTKFISRLDS